MSERWPADIEGVIDTVLKPNTFDEQLDGEEFYQFSGGKSLPPNLTGEQARLASILLLLYYQEGDWHMDCTVQGLIEKRLGI